MSSNAGATGGGRTDTRSRVLEAAWTLTVEHGVSNVTLAEIARKAGVSRQSVYLFFGSRAGLLTEMTRHKDRTSGISRKFVLALRDGSGAGALKRTIQIWFDYIPEIYPVARALSGAAVADDEAEAAWNDRMDLIHDLFLRIARRLEDEGALAAGWNAGQAADFIHAQAHFSTWHHLVKERGWTPEEAAARVVSALSATLLRNKG